MTAPIPHSQFDDLTGPGWTPERKVAFLDHLAQKGNVRAACKRVGLSREAAYCLRRRDPLFARGWAAALVQAREASVEVLADRALDGIEEQIYYRGELVGTRRKYDTRLLLAHLARLDKLVEERPAANDAARFDELLACIAGEHVPPEIAGAGDALPLTREQAGVVMGFRAREAAEDNPAAPDDDGLGEARDFDCWESGPKAEAYRRGQAEGAARWDGWFGDVCNYVDWASGRCPEEDRISSPGQCQECQPEGEALVEPG